MAIIADNFEQGVATQAELSELDDAALANWLDSPEAVKEFLTRRYGSFDASDPAPKRHLPGQHDQKDHGHGGGGGGSASLTADQYDAILPGKQVPTEKESSTAARAVTKTPEGKRLRRTTVAFQSKAGEVDRIQHDFMTRAAGKSTGDSQRDKDMDILTSAIRHAPQTDHVLYRAFTLGKDVDVFEWQGKQQNLSVASFSSDMRVAKSFRGATLKQGRRRVFVTLLPGSRALPIEKFGTPKYAYEREWITAGGFKVTKVKQVQGHWQVEMEHVALYKEAS